MRYTIYIYENLINGKVYIGQTEDLQYRDFAHNKGYGLKDNMAIDIAIKKYGRDNFSLNVITTVDTKEQANYTEIDWIARARELLGRQNVYNKSNGGGAPMSGRKHTPETLQKMSDIKMGHTPTNIGKKSLDIKIKYKKKKLNIDQVNDIRNQLKRGCAGRYLANKYSVSEGLISMIKSGRCWS